MEHGHVQQGGRTRNRFLGFVLPPLAFFSLKKGRYLRIPMVEVYEEI